MGAAPETKNESDEGLRCRRAVSSPPQVPAIPRREQTNGPPRLVTPQLDATVIESQDSLIAQRRAATPAGTSAYENRRQAQVTGIASGYSRGLPFAGRLV